MAETLAAASGPPWGICYHVQQAVEKVLKALIVEADNDPPRTHNLLRLNAAIEPPVFGPGDEGPLASLAVWAVQQRYPADQPEPTRSDAEEALDFGRRALTDVERRRVG
jgi:HEPN domain-containing protein